ncbi:hypothetical protein HFO42_06070 [Rhizobium leguminosarum]|uniref:Uncharacterized protein n=1 Tax=Rhizobium leguminosarum TaxID=384 RepID=A0AAJ1A5Y8_RHILE|nr:hypothetical protein [Rhizobium leguminosarum]MBY5533159.1 hypothetical protein [Rhizobium leguminosarum]MBY5592615.1 hypothetical protein [Rhizobium leguminosarum]MBY5593950.1 hypothetical protein [Rhizobium leguminosarum]MBY5600589.1 hypothetical protein [Rhizobium leguminosarum]MBY5614347.1 hypothetical protein [Rhizobium leguminosarum]
MIRSQIADAQTALSDEEVALCQRVFDHISSVRELTTDTEREDLAQRVIHSYQHGVKDEAALMRLLI